MMAEMVIHVTAKKRSPGMREEEGHEAMADRTPQEAPALEADHDEGEQHQLRRQEEHELEQARVFVHR